MFKATVKHFWVILIAFSLFVMAGITCCDHSNPETQINESAFMTCVVVNSTCSGSSVYLTFTDGHTETKAVHVGENHLMYDRTYVLKEVSSVNPLFVVVKNSNIWVLKDRD